MADSAMQAGDRNDDRDDPGPAHPHPTASASNVIDIRLGSSPHEAIDINWLADRLSAAMRCVESRLQRRVESVSVLIVNDERMKQLHDAHKGDPDTTDVLSFDLSDSARREAPIIAEIVVCSDVAARRAVELGHSIERELLLYIVHGLLHCAGFDDHDQADYQRMHETEDDILSQIGVGRTFSSGQGDRSA